MLRVPRVDYHHLEPALFQDFEDRDPVNPGRFHHDRPDAALGEPVGQPVKVIGEGLERSDRFLVAIRADSRDMYRGADIDRGRGRMNWEQTTRLARPLRL